MPLEGLYLGDCLSILPTLERVDAVITDPPYGINALHDNGKMGGTSGDSKRWKNQRNTIYAPFHGDDKPIDPAPILAIGNHHILWGGNYIADKLPPTRGWLVWYKRVNNQSNNQGDCELAWTDIDTVPRVFHHLWMGMVRDSEMGEHYHPTQKPVALMEWCIELCTNPGDTVIDPYMGSGTTGVACARLGRKFIGIERDPTYFAIAEKRIREARSQLIMELA